LLRLKKQSYSRLKKGKSFVFHPNYGFKNIPFYQKTKDIRLIGYSVTKHTFIARLKKENVFIKMDTLGNIQSTYDLPSDAYQIILDKNDKFWLLSDDFYPRLMKDSLAPVSLDEKMFKGMKLGKRKKKYPYQKSTDNFWLSSHNNLIVFHPERGIVYNFKETHPEIYKHTIHRIFFDRQYNIWIATTFGLYKVTLQPNLFKTYMALSPKEAETQKRLAIVGIYSKGDIIWINSQGRQPIHKIHLRTGQVAVIPPFKYLKTPPSKHLHKKRSPGRINTTMLGVFPYDNHQLLFSRNEVLMVYNPTTKEHHRIYPQKKKERIGQSWSFLKDQYNKTWLGLLNNGLRYLNSEKDTLIQFKKYNEFTALEESSIYSFLEWDNNHILIGSTSGLYVLHRKKGIIHRFWSKGEGDNYMPSSSIFHLKRDKKKLTKSGLVPIMMDWCI